MYKYILLSLLLFLISCGKDDVKISSIKENKQELEFIGSYNDAYKALTEGDPYFAAKKFLETELLFPQSKWAPRSALMASYSFYLQNFYAEALNNLERYLKTYPKDKNLAYAHYLIAMCYYETIEGEKKDLGPLLNAKKKFQFIIKEYPSTDFALDAEFKLGLIQDLLAAKEMYIGRHYIKKKRWIAALNRFKFVLEKYDQTIFVEEALHRLVELNYMLGLTEESKKYANILGYNYQSSQWYKKTYKIFNRNYLETLDTPLNQDKKSVIEKFKSLFE